MQGQTENIKRVTFLETLKTELSDKNSRLATLTSRLEILASKAKDETMAEKSPSSPEAPSTGMLSDIESLVKQYDKYQDRLCFVIEKLETII